MSLRVNFVLKSTTLLLLCSYHVLKWELFILDSIILFLCFARSKFCSKISRFSMGIALTLARTARLTLYGTFFTIYCKWNARNARFSKVAADLPDLCCMVHPFPSLLSTRLSTVLVICYVSF